MRRVDFLGGCPQIRPLSRNLSPRFQLRALDIFILYLKHRRLKEDPVLITFYRMMPADRFRKGRAGSLIAHGVKDLKSWPGILESTPCELRSFLKSTKPGLERPAALAGRLMKLIEFKCLLSFSYQPPSRLKLHKMGIAKVIEKSCIWKASRTIIKAVG
jgi:hypothetical protein